ncbi:MAG: glycoside hydrolase family 65 protein [Anaerolineae bacterium]|nr:glycoside hydrolase family 65 protein [Anaerolineae bacterium]
MMQNWHVVETEFAPETLHHKETVFTTGNGYLGTRGAFEEGYPGERAVTLIHGVFDDVPIVHTELANAPRWYALTLLIDGERFRLEQGQILAYRRQLDLATGVLARIVRWRSPKGHTVEVAFERFASLADEHVLAVRCRVTSVDFSGPVEIRGGLPGLVDNDGFMHWEWRDQGILAGDGVYLELGTRASGIVLGLGCALAAQGESIVHAVQDCEAHPTLLVRSQLQPGATLVVDKLTTLFTSRDTGDVRTTTVARLRSAIAAGYAALRAVNDAAWSREWEVCDIQIEGDDAADLAVRYSLFQLLIAAPRRDDRVSIAAKSLSGYGYRGHVFWDTEIFMLPFFTYVRPELARNMLMYRYHTLAGARRKAAEGGWEGAMFSWESAATGDETTPRWVPAPDGSLVRIWCGDIELHITADVAFAVYQYWQITADDAFLRDFGAEIILDTARFWGTRAEWNTVSERYEINDVIGPDEYHDHVDNNAFTNRMAVWNLQTALEILAWLDEQAPEKAASLRTALDLTPERLSHWRDVCARMVILQNPETGLFEQFEGFFERRPVSLEDFEPRSTSMQALLGIEETQAYQILKQPDVLMLLYLLESAYDPAVIKTNWDYYTPRTDLTYGSSLGPAIQAALAARQGDLEAAYGHFTLAARTDLQDARGNTGEGIHAATAGGLWQAVVFGFAGIRLTPGGLEAHPMLPDGWRRLRFRLHYRGKRLAFDLRSAG